MELIKETIESLGLRNSGLKGDITWLFKEDSNKSWTTLHWDVFHFGRITEKAILVYLEVGCNIGASNPVYEVWVPKSCIRITPRGRYFDFQIATWLVMKNGWFTSKLRRAFR